MTYACISGFISQTEVNDLENLPMITKNILKTPEVKAESNLKNDKVNCDNGSPQFKVGWNDNSDKNDLGDIHFLMILFRLIAL